MLICQYSIISFGIEYYRIFFDITRCLWMSEQLPLRLAYDYVPIVSVFVLKAYFISFIRYIVSIEQIKMALETHPSKHTQDIFNYILLCRSIL